MRKKILFICFLLILPLFVAIPIFAQSNLASGDTVSLPRNAVLDTDYFAAGESVTVSGTVNGDAYVAGGNVLIDGTINGDLLVAGGNVTIRGTVTADVRAAGGSVIISGDIGDDITVTGGNVSITDSAQIAGSVVGGVGNLEIFAPIGKGITLGAGQVTLGNSVGGDITAGVGQLNLTSDASVSGNLTYWSENKAQLAQGASVSGTVRQEMPDTQRTEAAEKAAEGVFAGINLFWKIVSFTSALILGLVFIKFMPRFTRSAADTILDTPLKSLLIGLIALIVTPVIVLLLLVFVVTIPLAFILLVGYILAVYVSKIFAALALGIFIAERANWKWQLGWVYLVGLFVLYLIGVIPVLGAIIGFFAMLAGLGALLSTKKEYYTTLGTKKMI